MNKITLFCGVALLQLFSSCHTDTRPLVINDPDIEIPCQGLNVTQIELTDSSTRLTFHASYPKGYWIKIAPATYIECENKRYLLASASGLNPNEKNWIKSDSGYTFSLIFPALPTSATSINFSEGDAEDAWQIKGISLRKCQ